MKRIGFSQVEPNHMSGMVTGQIFAQLPVDREVMGDIIENGRFAKYDGGSCPVDGKVTTEGDLPWMMIYNEEKLYDERKQSHKDFAMVSSNYCEGEIVPRLWMVLLGDIFTTNAFGGCAKSDMDEVEFDDLAKGDKVHIGADGYLVAGAADSTIGDADMEFTVVKVYTMADGQDGIKLMRTK